MLKVPQIGSRNAAADAGDAVVEHAVPGVAGHSLRPCNLCDPRNRPGLFNVSQGADCMGAQRG
jgi:hypothetical protein|tara:strand:+ start:439 stop:627 length:189 start_codon:yes stop_codon:yes gene_type:complete